MNLDIVALVALALAAIPCGLFLLNLCAYRPLRFGAPPLGGSRSENQTRPPFGGAPNLSVLIPARNEAHNLRATLEAVLANHDSEFEVIVLDDHSTDLTADIVREFARRDARIRLESAPPLPSGWCGKQHACHVLARLARHPLLVFIDADVRLAPDALARMAEFMNRSAVLQSGACQTKATNTPGRRTALPGIALASGVPRQELGTFSERLLIPQIHFILLGFLPMHAMRRTKLPALSAGCGQLFIARRDAYLQTGGHALIRSTLHDGVKLPRLFRQHGFKTDLFDATDLATCRMYRTNAETWRGLGKNATEGLAAPATIIPMTALLLGGQVLPFVLLAGAAILSPGALMLTFIASVLACVPRLLAVRLFRQPIGSALLHPLGVVTLLAIQWLALIRRAAGKSSEWKGRSYAPVTEAQPAKAT